MNPARMSHKKLSIMMNLFTVPNGIISGKDGVPIVTQKLLGDNWCSTFDSWFVMYYRPTVREDLRSLLPISCESTVPNFTTRRIRASVSIIAHIMMSDSWKLLRDLFKKTHLPPRKMQELSLRLVIRFSKGRCMPRLKHGVYSLAFVSAQIP